MKDIPGLTVLQGQAACDRCKGRCCKRHPGLTAREQWSSWEEIEEALLSRKWVIDSVFKESFPHGFDLFFVRPATIYSTEVFDVEIRSTAGMEKCVFLTEDGCSLDEEGRPQQCKNLEARAVEIDISALDSVAEDPFLISNGDHGFINQCGYPDGASGASVSDSWRKDSQKLAELGRRVEAQLSTT